MFWECGFCVLGMRRGCLHWRRIPCGARAGGESRILRSRVLRMQHSPHVGAENATLDNRFVAELHQVRRYIFQGAVPGGHEVYLCSYCWGGTLVGSWKEWGAAADLLEA